LPSSYSVIYSYIIAISLQRRVLMYTDPNTVALIKRLARLPRQPQSCLMFLYTIEVNIVHEPQRLGIRVREEKWLKSK
jgi:hypothetical protein